jgi:Ca2+-binding RTX toxin-like protein
VRIPVSIDAGDGNDTVFAGGSSAILVGGDGNDMLFGSSRRDLIIGGAGQDQLFGHGSSDLLIGGATAFDQNQPALRAIQSAWNARTSLANRIANLTTGADSSLAPLGVSLKPGETVLNDAGVDTLLGSTNTDWLFSSDPQNRHTHNRRGRGH